MDQVIGVLGGGQLGRMFVEAANRLNTPVIVLDSGDGAPAKQLQAMQGHAHVDGPFTSAEHIRQLAAKVDVITVEIEHVDAYVLEEIENECKSQRGRSGKGIRVFPAAKVIQLIQDKFTQKEFLATKNIPLPDFLSVEATDESIRRTAAVLGLPLMLKSRTLAYDGRGNYLLKTLDDTQSAIQALGNGKRALYAERFAPFTREIAVMVVRSPSGQVRSYPAVETIQKENICHLVHAPLRSRRRGQGEMARILAEASIAALGQGAVGVFGVEMFEMADGSLLLNEIAPRPHNSGHYTIEACYTSQFENHLRAIAGLPLGDCSLKVGASIMVNLLGSDSDMKTLQATALKALELPGATVHLYGKGQPRPGRKMGHVTICGGSEAEVIRSLRSLLQSLPKQYASHIPETEVGHSDPHPLVSIIMGSDSDLPVMKTASEVLTRFKIAHELEIVSAHRTPELMVQFAKSASERGVHVIIAGAGGAAHLPGMVAALTSLPVVGVPVKGSSLDGVDSLHSIVQMPRGIPVATVAINNSTNAALLAVRILACSHPHVLAQMDAYLEQIADEVHGKRASMAESGWVNYKSH